MARSDFDVVHLAELARMNLAGEEKGRFERELGKVLEYVNQLQKIDAEGVEETAQVTGLLNVFQQTARQPRRTGRGPAEAGKDSKTESIEELKKRRAEMLAAAPETQDGFVKIPAIF